MLQEDLRRLGFDPGRVDGRFGPRTRAAIVRFERAQGGVELGEPTPELCTKVADARLLDRLEGYRRAADVADEAADNSRALGDAKASEDVAASAVVTVGHPREEGAAAYLAAARHYVTAGRFWDLAGQGPEAWKLRAKAGTARSLARECADRALRGFVSVAKAYADAGDALQRARALAGASEAAVLGATVERPANSD